MAYLLQRLLTEAAARQPQRPAVASDGCLLTYQELDRLSNKLARALLRLGVTPGDRVGILAPKSAAAVLGIYGALKAGACYVPLDPKAPAGRLSHIVRDSGAAVIVADEARASQAATLSGAAPAPPGAVVVSAPGRPEQEEAADVPAQGAAVVPWTAVTGESGEPLAEERAIETDLAYILYTSGSTGQPKGVMLSHRNALAFVDWAVREFEVGAADRLSSHAPFHFDLSVFDLYAAASAGAALVLVPPEMSVFPLNLARFMRDAEISVWYSVPSILTMLVLRGNVEEMQPHALRTILFAGEVFPTKYLRRLIELLPGVRFANLYGPTETNVCTWYEVPTGPGEVPEAIPIGRPIDDVEVYAAGEDGQPVAAGGQGELYVTGPTVMHGYWNDPERTERTLLRDASTGDRTYRTGDLVQRDPGGDWLLLGRRDAQIKSRGYRIELGEIEAAINQHPAVVECAVVAVPDDVVTNRIKAFVSPSSVDEKDVQRFCLDRLPRYMVPEVWKLLDELPKTSTGKIARNALQEV